MAHKKAQPHKLAINFDRPPALGEQVEVKINSRIRCMVLIEINPYKTMGLTFFKLVWAFKCPTCNGSYTMETTLKQKTIKLHCVSCAENALQGIRDSRKARAEQRQQLQTM